MYVINRGFFFITVEMDTVHIQIFLKKSVIRFGMKRVV